MPVVRRNAIKSRAAWRRWAVWAGQWLLAKAVITADGDHPYLDAVAIKLAAREQTGMMGAAIQTMGRNEEDSIRGN